MARPHNTFEQVCNQHVIKTDKCWVWLGSINGVTGYGEVMIARRKSLAHRLFYEQFKGAIPEGMQVDHLCRFRWCVNPEHLEAVTPQENTLRSDNPPALNARKTHCKRGHPLSGDNLRMYSGQRECRECGREHVRARRRRLKAAAA